MERGFAPYFGSRINSRGGSPDNPLGGRGSSGRAGGGTRRALRHPANPLQMPHGRCVSGRVPNGHLVALARARHRLPVSLDPPSTPPSGRGLVEAARPWAEVNGSVVVEHLAQLAGEGFGLTGVSKLAAEKASVATGKHGRLLTVAARRWRSPRVR